MTWWKQIAKNPKDTVVVPVFTLSEHTLRFVRMGNDVSAELVHNSQQHWSIDPTEEYDTENERGIETTAEKCYDPRDKTLIFVDGPDDLDFLYMDYKSPRARMSCGHAVTPMSLTDWCNRLLDEGKSRFVCGFTGCDIEWTYEEVRKMALLTPEEVNYFEKKMFENAKGHLQVKMCPGCKSYAARTDHRDLSVKCTVCTAEKGRKYMFCWQCLNEWKGPVPRFDRCENADCQNPLDILKNCPNIVFEDVKGVTGCPSIRACPTCGLLVEHDKKKCKNVTCVQCKNEFCFVCLKLTEKCKKLNPNSYYSLCSTGVAPRQTYIPVWQRT